MHPVSHVETLDALAPWYCVRCASRVRESLAVAPWSARGRWERGRAFFRRADYARAVVAFEAAVRASPLEPRYHNELGAALLAGGDREGARAAFGRATELAGAGEALRAI
jgi:Flp pilus assembly protein TadD